jgi:hypothetical protein
MTFCAEVIVTSQRQICQTGRVGQPTQWPKDTKGVFRIRKSKKDRQHNDQKIPKEYSESVNLRTDNTMTKRNSTRFTDSEYSFGIFWSLCCLSFLDVRILNTPLVSFGHCVEWPKDTKGVFRIRKSKKDRQHNDQKIPKEYSESVNRRRTILNTPLVSFGHCVVCPS